jgi:hypothetical protein
MNGENGIFINGVGTVNWLEGNINEDPVFVGTGEHPFQVGDLSPCIDAGTPDTTGLNLPAFDLAGEVRIFNERIDIGTYEWNMMVNTPEIRATNINATFYPNPVQESAVLSLNLKLHKNIIISIYSTTSTCLKTWQFENQPAGINEFTLNFSELPPGIYFLQAQIGYEMVTKKLIKL